jgi:prolyl 4-hydroxylase
MFITDYIKVYENAMPDELCTNLIQRFEQSPDVTEEIEHASNDPKLMVRKNMELDLTKQPDFATNIQPVLMKITELAVGKYQSELPVRTFPREIGCELFRIKKYRGGQDSNDYFAYHTDVNSHSSARRYLALCWYLNDVQQGGETFFPHPNVRIKPKRGRLAMYPSLWAWPHSEEHPQSDDKYVLRTYLHYL